MDKRDTIITSCLIVVTILTAILALPQSTAHLSAENQHEDSTLVVATNHFASLNLEAKAAYVYDLTNDSVLFSKNATVPLPLASLTKIMTAVTASDMAPQSTEVVVDASSLGEAGDSGLFANERWSLNKLLQYTLVASSNDGASAIAASLGGAAFIEAMNTKAHTLGLNDLKFSNPSGLDISPAEAGAYGSAHDVALLLAYAVKHDPSVVEPTRYPSYTVTSNNNLVHTAQNTDVLTNKIPSLIAGKTGYTDLAGGNLAIVFDAGFQHPIAIVVLGSTYNGRFSDMQTLVDATVGTITNK